MDLGSFVFDLPLYGKYAGLSRRTVEIVAMHGHDAERGSKVFFRLREVHDDMRVHRETIVPMEWLFQWEEFGRSAAELVARK